MVTATLIATTQPCMFSMKTNEVRYAGRRMLSLAANGADGHGQIEGSGWGEVAYKKVSDVKREEERSG